MSNNRPTSTNRPISSNGEIRKMPIKKATYRRDMTTINIVLTVFVVLIDIMMMYIALNITRYSSFSKRTFIIINIVLFVLLLIINIGAIYLIRTRRKGLLRGLLVVTVILAMLGGYGTFAIAKVNFNVDRITDSGSTKTETVEASIVVYGEGIDNVDGLDGKVVGVPTGTSIETIAKSNLESASINATYVEYDDYTSAFVDLISGSIDAAVLPSNYQSIFANEDGISEYLEGTSILVNYSDSVVIEGGTTNNNKDLTSEPFTVLLIGTADGLSDAIMVATVNPISMKVTITSIARDSWVPIASGGNNKINSARPKGVQNLINTVQNLLGIEIDYYVDTNFQGVVDVVNALGGITITNSTAFTGQNASSERGHFNVYVPAGEDVPVDGEQALAFARERHLYASGDFQRQKNQQQVIMSILTKLLRTRDVNTALNVLQAAGDNVTTNFTIDQLTTFFNYVMKKGDRYYDDAHIENVFLIQTSRVTGYNSSEWNEAAQISLSVVRPYQGSIADNKVAITRNTDLNSTPTGIKYVKWDATWEYESPTITNDVYSEAIVQSQTPESYYCSKSGGTWDGSSCSCPGGNEYISQSGCVADNAANYGDQASCNYAGFKWAGSYCTSACPAGSVDNNGVCQATGAACQENATLGADGVTCVCNAGFTKDGSGNCVASGGGAPDPGCAASGGTWDGSNCACPSGTAFDGTSCVATPPATIPDPGCGSTGGAWNGSTGTCTCPANTIFNGTNCIPITCVHGTPDGTGKCQAGSCQLGYEGDNCDQPTPIP